MSKRMQAKMSQMMESEEGRKMLMEEYHKTK